MIRRLLAHTLLALVFLAELAGCKSAPPTGLHTVERVQLGPALGRPLVQVYRLTVVDVGSGAYWHHFYEHDTVTGFERLAGVKFVGFSKVRRP